jgi:NADH dehydrogenase [ubiquinone] 1 alpha subcomplex assembly factor 7
LYLPPWGLAPVVGSDACQLAFKGRTNGILGAIGAVNGQMTAQERQAVPSPEPPERLDHYMARANAIYYATHDPFADFTTSPEISQVFGEIIGLWAAVTWQLLLCPDRVLLVEAGPGRGTLMQDALRAVALAAPDFAAALSVHLIETSPRLRGAQAERLRGTHPERLLGADPERLRGTHPERPPGAHPEPLPHPTWHDSLTTVPGQPMILVANEFLDALPIRQFVRRGGGWTERFVAAGQWIERPANPDDVPPGRPAAEGDIIEVNEPARGFIGAICQRLALQQGAALILDYGPERSAVGDSLQALARKRPVDPLIHAGSADLTAHVDFADLAGVARARGASVHGPVPQGPFLAALGLFQRTERLARGRPPAQASALIEAARRLAEPAAMGHLFKVMAICSPSCPSLPGFPPPSPPR